MYKLDMLNIDTIKFIGLLNKLASMSIDGFHPFSKVATERPAGILYDDTQSDKRGYPLIADICVDEYHHDIISTYTKEFFDLYKINIGVIEEDGQHWIEVTSELDKSLCIVIDNGEWYQTLID